VYNSLRFFFYISGNGSGPADVDPKNNVENGPADGAAEAAGVENVDPNNPGVGTKRARSRVRNTSKWKKNIRKCRRNAGEDYTSLSNKHVPRKKLEHVDCGCEKRCVQKISEVRCLQLHESFWNMGDWSAQNAFLVGLVKTNCSEMTQQTRQKGP